MEQLRPLEAQFGAQAHWADNTEAKGDDSDLHLFHSMRYV